MNEDWSKAVDGTVKPERIVVMSVESDFDSTTEIAVIFDGMTPHPQLNNVFVSITPQSARQLAEYLIKLADEIEKPD